MMFNAYIWDFICIKSDKNSDFYFIFFNGIIDVVCSAVKPIYCQNGIFDV